jgi:hypothetical protein
MKLTLLYLLFAGIATVVMPARAGDADIKETLNIQDGGRIEIYMDGEVACFDRNNNPTIDAQCQKVGARILKERSDREAKERAAQERAAAEEARRNSKACEGLYPGKAITFESKAWLGGRTRARVMGVDATSGMVSIELLEGGGLGYDAGHTAETTCRTLKSQM